MKLAVSCVTDVGTTRPNNQDSCFGRVITLDGEQCALLVMCDGMGGFEKGEIASASVTGAFEDWFSIRFPNLYKSGISDDAVRKEWTNLIETVNDGIKKYAAENAIQMGTTLTACLITQNRFYIVNVGDSRAYEIHWAARKITNDHSLVAREVARGNITEAEALTDKRRNVLLQCVGAAEKVVPDFFFGKTKVPAVMMLCSDGFWHTTNLEELQERINPFAYTNEGDMQKRLERMVKNAKNRGEKDNISVIVGVMLDDGKDKCVTVEL